MNDRAHHHHAPLHDSSAPATHAHAHAEPLNRVALAATLHCLSGCAIGEVAGLLIGTALGWGNGATIVLAVVLAFASGFAMTAVPFLRRGFPVREALRIALAADTVSIAIMEFVDNGLMLAIPGAMNAPIDGWLFWGSMAVSLAIAGVVAYPANRWLIARGRVTRSHIGIITARIDPQGTQPAGGTRTCRRKARAAPTSTQARVTWRASTSIGRSRASRPPGTRTWRAT